MMKTSDAHIVVIVFPEGAHGFKLSAYFNDRLYYYPNENYDMDFAKIPSGRWVIVGEKQTKTSVEVKLKRQ